MKEEEECIKHLYANSQTRGVIAWTVDIKASRLKKKGVKAMMKACKIAFTVGFEKCKSMIQAHLPTITSNFCMCLYECLKAVIDESIQAFMRISEWLLFEIKVNAASQTEECIARGICEASTRTSL